MSCEISLLPYTRAIVVEAWAFLAVGVTGGVIYAVMTRLRSGVQRVRFAAFMAASAAISYMWGAGMSSAHVGARSGEVTVASGGYEASLPGASIIWSGQRPAGSTDLHRRMRALGTRKFNAGWFRSDRNRDIFIASPRAGAWLLPTQGEFDLVLPRSAAARLQACLQVPMTTDDDISQPVRPASARPVAP